MSKNPSVPESTELKVYAAYQAALDAINEECKETTDTDVLIPLNDAAQAFSDFLTEQNELALQANTAVFTSLTPGMKKANDGLNKLKDQLDAIQSKLKDFDKVLSAITGVLELAGKFV